MPLNKTRIQQYLRDFNFRQLFIEELGWDNPPTAVEVTVDGQRHALPAIAHKRGMVAYQCAAPEGARIPEYALRRKIDQQIIKTAHEHLIIFTDYGKTTQIWQWVKREPGKPAACREHTFNRLQSGEALFQKLQTIAFSFDEEEILTLVDVASRTRKGFDVERVTKRFYDQFKKEHASFLKFVEGIDAVADREWYASVMLNRLMFVYFVQRKGFLDGDPNYLRNRLKRCQDEKGRDKFYSFYRYFLLRLFHEGLGGKARPKELQDLLGRIPYLNGGFFEKHSIEQNYDKIHIPDKAFERVFDYFDQYQWHLDERPLRKDDEINPDVLGFIFEKYINQKQMGAYYTQEDITGYMSRNTIIPFLFDAARKACKAAFEGDNSVWRLLQADPDRYIYPAIKHGIKLDIHSQPPTTLKTPLPLPKEIEQGVDTTKPNLIERRKAWNKPAPSEYALPTEIWREVVARRQRYEELRSKLASGQVRDINDLVTLNLDIVQFAQDVIRNCDSPELLRAFWHALEKMSVLDPTVGSGAFLFAALNILKPLYEACLERMEAFVGDLDRSGEKHRPEKMSDFRAVLERVEAHPNPDYFILKSIVLKNLYGVDIMEEATEICKLRLFLKLAAQVDPDPAKENFGIEPLPDIDFNIRAGNTLVGYATAEEVRRYMTQFSGGQMKLLSGDELASYERFLDRLQIADAAWRGFRQQQIELGGVVTAKDKSELRTKFVALENELNRYLASDYGVKASDKEAFSKWQCSYAPFHWLVEFFGIVTSGGFDVLLGNPPWVEFAKVKDDYVPRGLRTLECNNLWAFVLERSFALAASNGRLGMIVPMSLVCTERMAAIQDIVKSAGHSWLSNYESDSNPGQLFDGVKQNVTILLTKRDRVSTQHTTRLFRFFQEYRRFVFPTIEFTQPPTHPFRYGFPKVSHPIESSILAKMFSHPPLASAMTEAGGKTILVHRIAHYYIKCMDFVPYFRSDRDGTKKSEDYKEYRFNPPADQFVAAINSTAFYLYWQVFFDAFKAGKLCVESFPFKRIEKPDLQERISSLAKQLMKDMKSKSERLRAEYAATGSVEYDQFYPRNSKPLMDEIDCALSGHYGFTQEELDFIVNYDIKYRLSRDAQGDDGE